MIAALVVLSTLAWLLTAAAAVYCTADLLGRTRSRRYARLARADDAGRLVPVRWLVLVAGLAAAATATALAATR